MSAADVLRIVSFNIGQRGFENTLDGALVTAVGYKAATGKKGTLQGFLASLSDPDILLLQELKTGLTGLTASQVTSTTHQVFFFPSRRAPGSSGVAALVRKDLVLLGVQEGITRAADGEAPAPPPIPSKGWGAEGEGGGGEGEGGLEAEALICGRVFSNAELDREGRAITLELALAGDRRLIVIGIYAPNNSGSAERAAYKWQWSSALQARIAAYQREQHGEAATIVVAGDFNVVPTALDHADPGRWEKEHGTLFGASIWRSWHGGLLRGVVAGHNSGADSAPLAPRADGSAQGLLDSFRIVHPGRKSAFTCWNSRVRARETNFGTRIDHILVSDSVCTRHAVKGVDGGAGAGAEAGGVAACACDGPRILDADVHQSIQGSDHCPVDVVLGGLRPQVATPGAPHPLSVAAHPSYSGAQRLVTSFFVKKVAPAAGAGAGAASAGAGAEARASASPSVTSAASKGAAASSGKSTGKRAAPGSIAAWVGTGAAKKSLRDGSGGDGGGGEDEVVVIDSSEEDKGWSAWDGEGASRAEAAKATWAALLQPPPPPPLCNCGLPMTQQVVRKEGPNKGRTFFTCSKPEGAKGDPKSHCGAFTWSKLGAC